MNGFITTTSCLLGLLALNSFAHAQAAPKLPAQEAEAENRTIRIIHPEGNDAERFVRSQHVTVGMVADFNERDGVMLVELHGVSYNFFPRGDVFIDPFKVIKPEDEQVLAAIKEFDEVLLIKSKGRPDHWEVAGIMGIYPKESDQEKPNGWLPANFVKDGMSINLFDLHQYRYQGVIDENLELLKDDNPRVRSRGMKVLGNTDPDDLKAVMVIDSIAGFIGSKDPDDRSAAIRAIGHIGGKHAERYIPLLAVMLEEGNSEKIEAVVAICNIGGPEAQKHIPRILELMSAEEGFPTYYIYYLGKMGKEASAALPAILGQLEVTDKKIHKHMQCIITALGEIGPEDPRVVEALTPLLEHEIFHVRDLSKKALAGTFARPTP